MGWSFRGQALTSGGTLPLRLTHLAHKPMKDIPCYQVDAFTHRLFAGNPAAVCLLDVAPEERWMQAVAAEMNLAETAFLLPLPNGAWSLRWFTPMTEVDL